jgi:hypothetical protein
MEVLRVRSEDDIFADLLGLCGLPGYVHALAMLCLRDNFVRFRRELKVEDMDRVFSRSRLIRTEITTLVGLLIRKPVDFSHPGLDVLQSYIDQTEALLGELHQSMSAAMFSEMLGSGAKPKPRAGGHVIIVRVPRSFIPPHRVVARDSNRFWARAGTTKYQPNVEQLRRLFNDAPLLADRIRTFQADRLIKITAGDTPISMRSIGKVAVHVIPVPSFADGRMVDIVSVLGRGTSLPTPLDELNLPAIGAVNLDGYLNCAAGDASMRQSYAQFFRNGAIEGVAELRSDDGVNSRFIGGGFTQLIVSHVQQYLRVLKSYELGLPVYVFLSLCNATKTVYRYSPEGVGWQETKPLGREIAAFPEVYVDSFDVDVPAIMRSVFNVIWNAFGLAQCEIYDGRGKLRGVS